MVDINKTIKETVKLKRDKYPSLARYVDLHTVDKKEAPSGNKTEPDTKKDTSRDADKNEGDKIHEGADKDLEKQALVAALGFGGAALPFQKPIIDKLEKDGMVKDIKMVKDVNGEVYHYRLTPQGRKMATSLKESKDKDALMKKYEALQDKLDAIEKRGGNPKNSVDYARSKSIWKKIQSLDEGANLSESRIADAVEAVKGGMKRRDAIKKFKVDGKLLSDALPKTGFYEWNNNLSEAISSGKMKLKDGTDVNVSDKDAKILNKLVSTLNGKNKKDMMETLQQNKEEFDAILEFARETV